QTGRIRAATVRKGEVMARNQKLTPILAGRVVKEVNQQGDALHVNFSDGSTMKVKTAAPAKGDELKNKKVKAVRQAADVMHLDFDDDTSAEIKLAEATSSVMLRDSKGAMEYAD